MKPYTCEECKQETEFLIPLKTEFEALRLCEQCFDEMNY